MDREQLLANVASEAERCRACPLGDNRKNCVPGEGDPQSRVLFVGEAPGREEDEQGRPFVGQAGQLLEGLLAFAGATRDAVYITNVVKCRPPGNRDPEPSEVAACRNFLERQITALNPQLIVTLGKYATETLQPGLWSPARRGKLTVRENRLILPLLHPAAALRRREWRRDLIQDFRQVADVMDGKATLKTVSESVEMTQQEETAAKPATEQASLF